MFDDPRSNDTRDRDDWRDRDVDARDRERVDPRDVFTEGLNLPRGREREIVFDRGHRYEIRGSEARTLADVGAFRVVLSRDLRDHSGDLCDPRKGDLRSLREQGLIRTVQLDGRRDVVVVLTKAGRDLLNSHRDRDRDRGQTFYADLKKPREVEHDAQVFRAYLREAERLQERGARIERVVLDYELKRDYQRFLQERNRGRADSDGRPDRSPEEIAKWAREHGLPCQDGHVQFPDFRIEYSTPDTRWEDAREHLDVEVTTMHYRGGHGAAAARSGFSCYGGSSARIGGSPFDPDAASEVLR
jgi:DNA-binding MarR family transcriptional regulator